MFGLFKNKKVKTCDEVGKCIHSQIIKVSEEKETIFTKDDNSKELIFFHSYLSSLLWFAAYNKGMNVDFTFDNKYKKYIIDGVNPSLWPHFLKAEALISLEISPTFDVKSLQEEAKNAATYDSDLLNSGDDMNLYRFLTGKELLTYNE